MNKLTSIIKILTKQNKSKMDNSQNELTEEDYELISQGLDHIINQQSGGFGNMLIETLIPDDMLDDPRVIKFKKDYAHEARKKEAELNTLKENAKVLQGKIITLKRQRIGNSSLAQVNSILNKNKK